jgi:hypothetical protein
MLSIGLSIIITAMMHIILLRLIFICSTLQGVGITGPGASWHYSSPTKPVNTILNGSIGICIDSGEGLPGIGGASYQNTVADVTIRHVDRGVFLGVQANGNIIRDLQMEAIGQIGYHLEVGEGAQRARRGRRAD